MSESRNSSGPKTATLDIERVPGRFRLENYRGSITLEGDFWDLSQWKSLIGRRLYPDEVTEWPRTICHAWRWLGQRRVEFAAEWESGGYEGMLQRAWEVYDRADIIVGHNVAAFDTKHLNTGWRDLGLTPPAPFKTVDTLRQAQRVFGDESKTLAALTERLGIETKTDKYDVVTARAAVAGDVKAQRKLTAYNKGDIIASEALYLKLLPWMHGHPHHALYNLDDGDCCQRCGGADLRRRGFAYTPLGKYRQFRCEGCGGWSRGKKNLAGVGVRAVTL
jgi:hypothetical protein